MTQENQIIITAIDLDKVAQVLNTTRAYQPQQLATEMRVTIQTLHNWRNNGILDKPKRVGRYTFWTQEQVDTLRTNLHTRQK